MKLRQLLPVLLLLAGSYGADAKCVMCFRNASAQNQERARALNLGVLILGVPPLLILGGLAWLAVRRDRAAPPPAG